MKKQWKRLWAAVCAVMLLLSLSSAQAGGDVERRLVRVGFFSADGYHVEDTDGTRSGYGFDFLQMMLRYNNWAYQFVGYDKNWGDMLDMLERGDIDLVTLANKTPEREERFAYSQKSIGSSAMMLTCRADNAAIVPGAYATYDGARVGLVTGSVYNSSFMAFAQEKGFTCTPVYYDDINLLLTDLRQGQNIDLALTSNMRQAQDEVILDELNATEYYVITRKDDTELMAEIDQGIAQLSVSDPEWRVSLYRKYYASTTSQVISLSVEERAYLQGLQEQGVVIHAAMNPELRPYAYFENGEARGIAPEIFREIADRLSLTYEILPAATRWEYKEQLNSGEADVDLTAFLDYSLAQRYGLKETDAYMTSALAMLTRKGTTAESSDMIVAVVRDPTEYIGYNNDLIYRYQYKEYESIQDCIDAVKQGEADATFRYVYIAEQAVREDVTNHLQYTILPDYTFGLCLGVKETTDHRLLSVLNKGVNGLPASFTQGVLLEESTRIRSGDSLLAAAYDHPLVMIAVAAALVLSLCAVALLLVRNHAQRNRLAVSRKMDRFISYVCENYELVTELNLTSRQRTDYRVESGRVIEEHKPLPALDHGYFATFVHPEDQPVLEELCSAEAMTRMAAEGGQRFFECRIRHGAGDYNWYTVILKAAAGERPQDRACILLARNVEQLRAKEEEQKQALRDALETARSASAAKGQFLSRMSHEIRTPLNAVIGYMEIARASADRPEKVMHCVENTGTAARHLLDIINDVLDISSIESGRMKIAHEEFNLKTQLTALSAMFFSQAKAKGVHFEVIARDIAREWVVGDSLRMRQILMNLLSNAIKFTPAEGAVTLTVQQMNANSKRVFMKFTVADTGRGMSEEYQQRLFRPFEQESAATAQQYGGTGLGLSIAHNLVSLMGGSIEATSRLGEGSTFVVSLSFEPSDAPHDDAPAAQQDYSHVRALIVDDDPASCDYMKALLKRCKVKSDVVNDGASAVKRVQGRMGSDYAYDLCLMDWNMPGMDGIETARRIRETCGNAMPIIIATAYDVNEFAEDARALGVTKIIPKPLFQSTMFDLLVSTFGKYEPAQPEAQHIEQLKGMKVLLAEDQPMNLEIAVDILRGSGMEVTPVTDGKQAVDAFLNAPAGRFDAILMDVQMPVMDGYQATQAIRHATHPEAATIPIIAMTANAFAEDVNAALASGMNGHIAKPVDYDKLYKELRRCCGKDTKHDE